jgi:hypothetical protein
LSLVIHASLHLSAGPRSDDSRIGHTAGQLDHIGNQAIFISTSNRNLALRGSVLPQNAASAAF